MPLQEFGTPRAKQEFKSDYKKVLFVDLNSTATVRILTGYLPVYTHYINRITFQCLGEECPVCANNKTLIMQFPDTYKDESKYSPCRIQNLVNVLDKTTVRVCSKCQAESPTPMGSPATACKCGEILSSTPAPSMKIKVLSRGVTLFDQLDAINNAIMDVKGERVGLTGYDITFIVSGTGKNKTITPIVGQISDKPLFDEKDLYDLEAVTLKLTATELMDVQRGVSLKDVYTARRATDKLNVAKETILPKELLDGVQADVEALFKNN